MNSTTISSKEQRQARALLHLSHISKSFGGTEALSDVSLNIKAGNILALLGENGAGKSTLIKILAGVYPKDSGEIVYHDEVIDNALSLEGKNKEAISFIHQDLGLIDWMTIAENIGFSVTFPKKHGFLIDWQAMQLKTQEVLNLLGVDLDANERIMNLTRAEQSLVAISRAIAKNSKVIVLDEPTASLSARDVERLFSVLRSLKDQGVALVLVSHRLDEIFAVCDDVFILRDGKAVGQYVVSDLDEKQLVKLIVGKDTIHQRNTSQQFELCHHQIALECRELSLQNTTHPINLSIKRGEILALSGLRGAGQEGIGRALFGVEPVLSGDIFIYDEVYVPNTPYHAIKNGIGMLARDRIHESISMNMTVPENLFLNPSNHDYHFWYSLKQEAILSIKQAHKYDIRPKKCTSLEINALSGGNQQKVVMARWLAMNIRVLILEDPTQGVDIGARVEIYKHIEDFIAATQVAVILISTDFEEVTSIANRTLIFSKGDIVKELVGEEITVKNILYHASAA